MKRTRNSYNQDTLTNVNSIVKIPRTTFNMPSIHQTAFNGGKLIPLKLIECYPGDTVKMNLASLIRLNSPLVKAPMGEIEFSAYAFKVPMRILQDDFENIIANYQANPDWTSDVDSTLAGTTIPEGGFAIGSVADYFGIRPEIGPAVGAESAVTEVNSLPFRAYVKIGDEWFRDENLMNTAGVDTTNTTTTGVSSASGDYLTDAIAGGALYPVCKTKGADPWTTALPDAQKGAPVVFGIGGAAPVTFEDISGTATFPNTNLNTSDSYYTFAADLPIKLGSTYGGVLEGNGYRNITAYHTGSNYTSELVLNSQESYTPSGTASNYTGVNQTNLFVPAANLDLSIKASAYADLSNVSAVSVNDLRLAFQLQKIKEADARYGNRYREYLMGRWGVKSSDGRLQVPEYLGSHKMILNINQTVQTSTSTESSPQGNISSYSLTSQKKYMFETSCTEHCYIVIVGCCRIKHRTYSQGIQRTFLKRAREDFYVPELANIGEQPIYNAEIYYQGTNDDTAAFGFQEAFYDLRMSPNQVTGLMRPGVTGSLAVWNFADLYESLPTLSSAWIQEDMSALDRCLAFPSTTTPQFIADLYFDCTMTRPMPLHSIPGLIDHSWGSRF